MILIFQVFIFFISCILLASYLSLLERKLIARIQLRIGPDKCGFGGCVQPIADALKLFFKKHSLKGHSKQSVIAVCLMFSIALIQLTIIPISPNICLLDTENSILLILVFHSIFSYSEMLIGGFSKSKYGVIGGCRCFIQQIISIIPFILCLICVVLLTKTTSLTKIAKMQLSNDIILWYIPISIICFINMLMIASKIPFDFIEAESEIVAGTYTEYGGILFAMIFLSSYLNLLFISLIFSTLFLGSYSFFIENHSLQSISLITRALVVVSLVILIRAILPRYKQEHMQKISLPVLTLMLLVIIFCII